MYAVERGYVPAQAGSQGELSVTSTGSLEGGGSLSLLGGEGVGGGEKGQNGCL